MNVTLPIDDQPIPGAHEQYLRKPLDDQISISANELTRSLHFDPNFQRLNSRSRARVTRLICNMLRWAAEAECLLVENARLQQKPAEAALREGVVVITTPSACGFWRRLVGRKRA